jgi:hypothetical protein
MFSNRLFWPTAIFVLALAASAFTAKAADITVWPADKYGRIFVDVSGQINFGDEKTFAEKTQNLDADHTYVSLSSNGGNAISGGGIGDIIHFRGMNTYVPPRATCVSICGLIWLAGHNKFAESSAYIGVHGAFDANTLQPSNEVNILLAVYLAQLGYGYADVSWMLLPPPGNIHWLTAETTQAHHVYWAELNPTREQTPPALTPAVASTSKSRPFVQYTAANNMNLRSGPRWDLPSALATNEYIPASAMILAWADEQCRPSDGAVKPYGSKDYWCPVYFKNAAGKETNGWANAYYLLTSDGVRLGERFAQLQG